MTQNVLRAVGLQPSGGRRDERPERHGLEDPESRTNN
jgi:hypothetical protein